MHPWGYLTLHLYLARAQTNIEKFFSVFRSFGCLTKALFMNRTWDALRHLRRLTRLHYRRTYQMARYCITEVTPMLFIPRAVD